MDIEWQERISPKVFVSEFNGNDRSKIYSTHSWKDPTRKKREDGD